jgi:hypothetical protein
MYFFTACIPSSLISVTQMIGRHYILPKCRFLQEPNNVTSQKGILHSYQRENLKSYILISLLLKVKTEMEKEKCYTNLHVSMPLIGQCITIKIQNLSLS